MDYDIVEAAQNLANQVCRVSRAITPHAAPGHDEAGGAVSSLTEAVMGVTAGLCRIADAIEHLDAIAPAIEHLAEAVEGARAAAS